jgi:hypothetical protein
VHSRCIWTSPKIEEDVLGDLIELYLLGDVLDDVKLRNKTLRLLNTHICMGGPHLNSNLVNIIWDHTASNSMLRKWAVDALSMVCQPVISRRRAHRGRQTLSYRLPSILWTSTEKSMPTTKV